MDNRIVLIIIVSKRKSLYKIKSTIKHNSGKGERLHIERNDATSLTEILNPRKKFKGTEVLWSGYEVVDKEVSQ